MPKRSTKPNLKAVGKAGQSGAAARKSRTPDWSEDFGDDLEREDVAFLGPTKEGNKRLAVVTWEDITAYSRVEIPNDFEEYRLIKKTLGLMWSETADYVVLVQDYDVSNRGKGYHHNDFHIIPKGVIKEIRYLGEEPV